MKKILLFICLLASTHLVRGQELDQQNNNSDQNTYTATSFGQTFTVGKTGGVSSIRLLLATPSNTETKTLSIYDTDANGLPILTNVLVSATASVTVNRSLVSFNFPSPFYQLIAGKKYAFVINNLVFTRSASNSYSGGNYFSIDNSNAITPDNTFDITFFTYSVKFEPVTTTNATCNGAPNGGAVVKPLFGTAPYSYTWDNGETTATATKLTGGNHTLTVKDVNNITEQLSVTIGQPLATPLVFSATVETFVGAMCDNKGAIAGNTPLPVQLLPTAYDNTKITLGNDATVSTTNGEYTLTPDQNDKKGYILFNSTETQPKLFTAKFSLKGDNKSGADGFSFNYGEINTATSGSYENGILAKDASNNDKGLVIKFLTFNSDKIQIFYNGVKIGSDVATPIEDGNYHNYEVTITYNFPKYQITLKKDGVTLFNNVEVANYSTNANYRLAIAARTGGSNNNYRVKINPTFTDNTPYEYSLDNLTFTDYGYFQDIPAGQQKFFARLPGMTCGKLLGTYAITGTAPPAAPTVTSPQTFSGGSKISNILRPAAPTGYYNATFSDAAGTIGVGTNALLQSKTYYLSSVSLDGQCKGLLTPVVINVDNIPTIAKIAPQDVCNSNTIDVAVKLGDEDVNALTLTALSSNETILPSNRITISGTGADRIVKVSPLQNVTGIVTIKLTTKDANNTVTQDFVVRIFSESRVSGFEVIAGNSSGTIADNVSAKASALKNPRYIGADNIGNIYIGETGKVRRIDKATGKISTVATLSSGTIKGVAVDKSGNVFYTDGAIIYKIPGGTGTSETYAGSATGTQAATNTSVATANIGDISSMYMDRFDNLYVVTNGKAKIRYVLPTKLVVDLAGTGTSGYSGNGGFATSAKIEGVEGITKDVNGNVFFTQNGPFSYAIRKVNESDKKISSLLEAVYSTPDPGFIDNGKNSGSLKNPQGIDIDENGNLFVSQPNFRILVLYASNYSDDIQLLNDSQANIFGMLYDKSTALPTVTILGATDGENFVSQYYNSTSVTCNTVLPVTLTNFTAKAEGSKSKLEWTTASEQNNNRFEVQRSSDGINFATIATVEGNGNSTATNRYSAFDAQPVNGVNYYRLKQIDNNGKETIASAVKSVSFNFEDNVSAKLFPNPADDVVNISVLNYKGMQLNVNVIDVNGKVVHQEVIDTKVNASSYKLNLSKKLTPGYYSVKLSGVNYNTVLKLVVH